MSSSTEDRPITAFIGVRISWLMTARKLDFALLAASAASSRAWNRSASAIACARPASARLVSVMSSCVATQPPSGIGWCTIET